MMTQFISNFKCSTQKIGKGNPIKKNKQKPALTIRPLDIK